MIDGLARNLRDSLPHAEEGQKVECRRKKRSMRRGMPIYYESRVAKLGLNQSELPKIDEEFEAIERAVSRIVCSEMLV
ncbi:MAG: hypothetical protein M3480_00655 [Verrucomicrobiota bacterium]|nr:hypothetical protein [Verrucomicrobiota bacterium]